MEVPTILLNANNKYLTINDLKKILRKGGIILSEDEEQSMQNADGSTNTNFEIWQKAFIHSSYMIQNDKRRKLMNMNMNIDKDYSYEEELKRVTSQGQEIIPLQEDCNEILEFLGDSVIKSIMTSYLVRRFPKEREGYLSILRGRLEKTEPLAILGNELGFSSLVIVSKYYEEKNKRNNSILLEDTFEAFIGAMKTYYNKDGDSYAYEMCNRFFINLLEKYIDIIEMILTNDNYKDQLMRYFHKNFNGKLPKYIIDKEDVTQNSDGTKTYEYSIHVEDIYGNIVGKGISKSKKNAEKEAAHEALLYYGLVNGY